MGETIMADGNFAIRQWTIANYTPVAFTIDANRNAAKEMGYNPETSYELPKGDKFQVGTFGEF